MNDKNPVSFPGWKGALALSNLSPIIQSSHTWEIISFLHHCMVRISKQVCPGRGINRRIRKADEGIGPYHVAARKGNH